MRLTFLFSFFFLILFTQESAAQNNIEADLKKLEIFLTSIDNKYVDSVNTYQLVERAIKEVLKELDPHSIYLSAESYQSSTESLNGKFKGIGIRYQIIDDTLTVLEVFEGSGAERANVQLGDQIIAAGNDTLAGKNLSGSVMSDKLDQNAITNEGITVWRKGGKERSLKYISRTSLSVSSIPAAFLIDQKVGYIKLNKFTDDSASDLKLALEKLNDEGLKQLILDLRGNTGGYLNRAIKIADEFLEDRKLIVYTEGKNQPKRETFATSAGKFTSGELVILLDENSASASEILAGAIQDWDRGLIVGRRSFGKGLVQRPIEFEDGSAMRLTISRYYTPTGRSIQQSYDDGVEAYKLSHKQRNETGELISKDSIQTADSLVFYTPKNRTVYGGGGIIPDIFVPEDSTTFCREIRLLRERGLIYGYSLKLALERSQEIKKEFGEIDEFSMNFALSQELLDAFQRYLEVKKVENVDISNKRFRSQLEQNIKLYTARFVYGYDAYYKVLIETDQDVIAARDALENNKHGELGLK